MAHQNIRPPATPQPDPRRAAQPTSGAWRAASALQGGPSPQSSSSLTRNCHPEAESMARHPQSKHNHGQRGEPLALWAPQALHHVLPPGHTEAESVDLQPGSNQTDFLCNSRTAATPGGWGGGVMLQKETSLARRKDAYEWRARHVGGTPAEPIGGPTCALPANHGQRGEPPALWAPQALHHVLTPGHRDKDPTVFRPKAHAP